jgi:hypothetical protein
MRLHKDLILLDSLRFINNTFISMPLDAPLPIIYRNIFAVLIRKLKLYAYCSHGLHLMGKVIFDQDKNPVTIKTEYLYISRGSEKDLSQDPKLCNGAEKDGVNSQLPQYVPFTCKNPAKNDRWYSRLKRLLRDCPKYSPIMCSSSEWLHLFNEFKAQSPRSTSNEAVLHDINYSTDKLLVIVLSNPTLKHPCGQLGTVLLWNRADEKVKAHYGMRFGRLKTAVKYLSVYISQLLKSQHGVPNDIYPIHSGVNDKTLLKLSEIKHEFGLTFTDDNPKLTVTV